MSNHQKPAFPYVAKWESVKAGFRSAKAEISPAVEYSGMSKREYIAAHIEPKWPLSLDKEELMGSSRPKGGIPMVEWDAAFEARIRRIQADALLAELDTHPV